MIEDQPPQQYSQFAMTAEETPHGFLHHESVGSNGGSNPQGKLTVLNNSNEAVTVAAATNLECIKPWDLEPSQVQPNLEIKEPIDEELDTLFKDNPMSHDENQQKLSQLRHMLEKNLKSPSLAYSTNGGSVVTSEAVMTSTQPPLSTRRRVSFIVQDPVQQQSQGHMTGSTGPNSGPGAGNGQNGPSPGTRKRHFSFQPISPRQASLPQSPSASPFISPRSTPVHMMRSRHSSGSALPLHMLPQGNPKNPYGSAGSDISRAATFGSASECSTPFISPHGTPIPFNRSRHNSAQGRLCRSRHSSGVAVGPYR